MRKGKKVEQKTSGYAIASFVLGLIILISVLLSYLISLPFEYLSDRPILEFIGFFILILVFFSPLILVVTIILSVIAFIKIRKNPELKGKSLAILGVILSALSVIITWGVLIAGHAIG